MRVTEAVLSAFTQAVATCQSGNTLPALQQDYEQARQLYLQRLLGLAATQGEWFQGGCCMLQVLHVLGRLVHDAGFSGPSWLLHAAIYDLYSCCAQQPCIWHDHLWLHEQRPVLPSLLPLSEA